MRDKIKKSVSYGGWGFLVLLLLLYGYMQARELINGPQLTIANPENGSTVYDPLLDIAGVASNISYITLDDRQIFVDSDGRFTEHLLLSPGYNIIEVAVRDRLGRERENILEILYK